jgi:hypothetical protein
MVLTFPLMRWLTEYEETFFLKQTFLYVLIFISINVMYSILLIIIFAIFRSIARKNQGQAGKMLSTFLVDTEGIFKMKDVVALGLFKILPLVELFVAFLGEWFALFLHTNIVLIFCAIYPVLMGAIQKLMDLIDEKCNLDLDLVAELYSLFYASVPYKLVYLNIEETLIGFVVLAIKFSFKMIVYVIVPTIKERRALSSYNSKVKKNKVQPAKLFQSRKDKNLKPSLKEFNQVSQKPDVQIQDSIQQELVNESNENNFESENFPNL